jgi:hypothetical protein
VLFLLDVEDLVLANPWGGYGLKTELDDNVFFGFCDYDAKNAVSPKRL